MNLILNTNGLGYKSFLNSNVSSIAIGLNGYSDGLCYCVNFSNLNKSIEEIKSNGKDCYLNINCFANEKILVKFKKVFKKLISLNVDRFIVSDLGIFNLFKEQGLASKVILDLQTYVTNKYSAKSLIELGANAISLSREITLNDIVDISSFCNGKVLLLCQGYYPITYSKRNILDLYYRNIKKHSKSYLHYVKEETRDSYYPMMEKANLLTVFYENQYSLFNYLDVLVKQNIENYMINSLFLSIDETNEYINSYSNAFKALEKEDIKEFEKLKSEFSKKHKYETPFMHNESFLLKEGN